MPPRYAPRSANPNQIKLILDYDTLDRLKAAASARKTDPQRCAYELLQEALGMRQGAPAAAAPEPASDLTFNWQQHTSTNPHRR